MNNTISRESMLTLAEDVATHLPGTWTVDLFPEDWGRHGAYLREASSRATLVLGESQVYADRNKNRLEVGTDYPLDRDRRQSSAKRPKISVSASKTGAQIAADVERRRLPEYLPILAREVAAVDQRRAAEDAQSAVAEKIARVVRVERSPRDSTVSFYHSPYLLFRETMSEAKVYSDGEVELTLRLDVETAVRLLEHLKTW